MNNKKTFGKKTLLAAITISALGTTAAIANDLTPETPAANKNISSTGGLLLGSPDSPHWFQVGGVIKIDEMAFMGNSTSRGQEFYNGANLRNAELDFEGGLGQDISYTLATIYEAKDRKVKLDDAFLTYKIDNGFTVSAGQLSPAFSLESTASSKWIPFLERSIATHALGTEMGIGASVSKWNKDYTFIAAAMQPRQDREAKNVAGADIKNRSDRWQTSARIAYRPIYDGNKIVQFGASGYFQDDHSAAARLKTHAEATARHNTDIIDTGYILASNHKAMSLELAGQNGPLYAEAEYQRTYVSRPVGAAKVHFHGYHVQVAYVLTGEARTFKEYNGTFGQVKPSCPNGAWEIAARYSMLNLNNKDINGGKGNNASIGLNYYLNNNVRIAGEYIRSSQHPSTMKILGTNSAQTALANQQKRKLNILGLRLQAVF